MTLALTVVVILGSALTSCDAALDALAKNEPLTGRVTASAGKQAAERLPLAKTAGAVAALSRISREAKTEQQLAAGLLAVIAASDARAAEAARQLEALKSDLLAVGQRSDPAAAKRALRVVVPLLDADDLASLLDHLITTPALRRQATYALQESGQSLQPLATYELLSGLQLSPFFEHMAGDALAELAGRNEKVSTFALELAEGAPTPAVLRSLSGLRPEQWEDAMSLLAVALEIETGARLAAAIHSAAELRMPEVVPLLPHLAREGKTSALRIAALRAIPQVSYRDAPTVDLLIELLGDPLVREESYRALRAKTGVALPLDPNAWQAWRRGFLLPMAPPVPNAERLDKERALLAVVRATTPYKSARLAPPAPERSAATAQAASSPAPVTAALLRPENALLAALGGLSLLFILFASRSQPATRVNLVDFGPAKGDATPKAALPRTRRYPKKKQAETKTAPAVSSTIEYVEKLVDKLDVVLEQSTTPAHSGGSAARSSSTGRVGKTQRRQRMKPRRSDVVAALPETPRVSRPKRSDTRRLRVVRDEQPEAPEPREPRRRTRPMVEKTACWDVLRSS
jgi:hypothetical protein